MKPLHSYDNPLPRMVIDTSVCINLNATGYAKEILTAIPNKSVIATAILKELECGRLTGRDDAELTAKLVSLEMIEVVQLGEIGLRQFEELVSGSAEHTIGDGEAATIALAMESGGIVLIDERKATRICATRFKDLHLLSTVDLFMHPQVEKALGRNSLKQAVLRALERARMNVPPHHLDWVTDLVGTEGALQCKSLPVCRRHVLSGQTKKM